MVRLLVIAGLVGAIAGACNPGVSTGSGSSGPAPVPDTGAPASGGGGGSAADGGSGGQQGGGASTDGGSSTESGSPATDGGTGTAADGGSASDGGTVAVLETVPCPEAPHLLWTRTFADEVDFHGTVDDGGNIYWIEYDPPHSKQNPDPPAMLVSVNPEGHERYRRAISVANGLIAVAGKLFASRNDTVAAYDDATGALAWTLDFAAIRSIPAAVGGAVRVTSDTVAVAVNDGSTEGIYFVDAKSGAITASNVSTTDKGRTIVASDGAGSLLLSANRAGTYPDEGDVFLIDASGTERWRERVRDAPPWIATVIAWPSGLPWLEMSGGNGISSNGHHWTSPDLFRAAFTDSIGIGFDTKTITRVANGSRFPVGIDVIRDHQIVARTLLDGLDTFNGIFVAPIANGDHVDFVAQDYHHIAGLCHMTVPGTSIFGRADSSSTFQCPLAISADDFLDVAALSAEHLIIGRTTLTTTACSSTEFDPVTIEAYSLPGGKP